MWPFTVSTRPMPQSGGVRHSLPAGLEVAAAVGQPGSHVVHQEIGIGVDRLAGHLGHARSDPVRSVGVWQPAQPTA